MPVSQRQLTELLRLLRVDPSGAGPDVSQNIQLVYVVDDLRHLVTPIPPVEGFLTTTVAAQAARVSGLELIPPPNAAVAITWARNDGPISSIFLVNQAIRITNDIVATNVDFTTGGTPRSLVQQGTRAVNATGLQLPLDENLVDRFPVLLVLPGQVFVWHGVSVNNAMTLSFSFREIPVP